MFARRWRSNRRGNDLPVPVTDGSWVGGVVEVEHLREPTALLVVRTFRDAEMGVRTAPPEMAGADL
jgi:hypothetical protein